jgi:hypothetical protein
MPVRRETGIAVNIENPFIFVIEKFPQQTFAEESYIGL